jgi:2-(1,2-epoxy-1,2-dihydrophenyl)acetyl-CoA isomerase
MTYKTLLYEVQNGIAVLTLNRPEHRNALSLELRAEFIEVILKIRNNKEVKAMILTGAGGAFCAGGDIGDMKKFHANTPTDNRQMLRDVHAWLPEFVNLEKPVIAAVDGPAYGAGFNMALAADFVLCTPRAKFCQVFARIGLVPDFGGLYLLPRIVGLQKAKELMYSARVVDAGEAKELGIVYAIHPPEKLMDAALDLAGRFRLAPTEVIGITKNLLNQSFHSDQRTMGELESFASMSARTVPYHQEAVQRFRSKQPPLYDWDRMDMEQKE